MTDYTSLSPADWLDLTDRFYAHLKQTLHSITPSEWNRITPYFGWRERDVLAHMTSAMPVNFREVLDRALADDPSAPDEFNTFWRNGREVAARRARSPSELLEEFWSELDALMATYRSMEESDWLKPAWFFVGRVNVRTVFLVQFGDNLFHDRDLLLTNGRWQGLDEAFASPLVDWFMREVRPANFRSDRAKNVSAAVLYKLSGSGGGEWTMRLEDGTCVVERGGTASPDVVIEADTEQTVAAAQARAAPFFGSLARIVAGVRGPDRVEDVVATVTGVSSLASAVLTRRLRIQGDRAVVRAVNRCFWHFWERTEQTEHNIAAYLMN